MSNAWTGIKSEGCISSYVATQKNYCSIYEGHWDKKQKESDKMSPSQCRVKNPSILELTIPEH
jgi:hypothetical protein